VEKPKFTLGRPGGPVNPATEIIPGANRHLYAVADGVAITDAAGNGVGLCPLDSPLVSLDRPGLWKFDMDFVPRTPTVYVNLYNNKWNTNFPLWQDGSWSERVRFWPTGDLMVPGWETRVPLLAAEADGAAGKLPKTQSGLTASRPGVLITAFGGNPDGIGTLLRVWELSGKASEFSVTFPAGAKYKIATPLNLRGEVLGNPQQVRDGKLAFFLRAYAPASFRLE
jgi:hypothetical protein